jgi:hypothetical protein
MIDPQQHIEYDEFGFFADGYLPDDYAEFDPEARRDDSPEAPEVPHIPIRTQFPTADSQHQGGTSDGWMYKTVFTSGRLAATYDMVRQFLIEEGYGDIPLPANADELRLFKRPRPGQLQFFAEKGYVHNPIKILFSPVKKQPNTLILCIFNEQAEGHLLRFHGVK